MITRIKNLSILLLLFSLSNIYSQENSRAFKSISPDIDKDKRVALLIGNGNYKGQAKLGDNPLNDAKDLGTLLKDLDFDVIIATDLEKSKMEMAIRRFQKESKSAEVALFFYAGHGMQTQDQNYLIPVEAKIEDEEDIKWECISLATIQDEMESEEKLNIIILDACRNNPYRTWVRGGESGLASTKSVNGTIIAFSTSPGSISINSDQTGRNGLYTSELMKQLKLPQRITDVFMNTRNAVFKKSKKAQRPWEDSSLSAPFYLNGSYTTINEVNLLIESSIDVSIQVNNEEIYEIKEAIRINKVKLNTGYNILTYLDPLTKEVLYEEKKNFDKIGNFSYSLPTSLFGEHKIVETPRKKENEKTRRENSSLSREASSAIRSLKKLWPDHLSTTKPYILENKSISFGETDPCTCNLTLNEYYQRANSTNNRKIVYSFNILDVDLTRNFNARESVIKLNMNKGEKASVNVYVDDKLKKELETRLVEFASTQSSDRELHNAFTQLQKNCSK